MNKFFRIGTFCFRIVCENDIPVPKNFLLFEIWQEMEPDVTFRIIMKESIAVLDNRIVVKRPDLSIVESEFGESRLIGSLGSAKYYAFYREISELDVEIQFSELDYQILQFDTVFTSLFALERQMIKRESLILHCAYIEYQGNAVLFSAPSETGKSTQADLWEQYRGSHTVNGDRALLRKIDGIWNACGWPVCGSSEICQKADFPIHAIVMLRQGKENHVKKLTGMQAFSQLYSQITINHWNREFVMKAMELLEDIVKQTPIWQMTCNMTKDAVECLESVLFPDIDRCR